MATPPAATPPPRERSGPGCLVGLLLLPVVIIAGLVIGTVLNDEDSPNDTRSVTLREGTLAGTDWRVEAARDVEGDVCAFLYEDGEQLNGACTTTPQDVTYGDQTVVFGRAASDATSVRVGLEDGTVLEVDTVVAEGIEGRFYVEVVDGDVDAEMLVP